MIDQAPTPYQKRRALSVGAAGLVLLLAGCSGNGNFDKPVNKITEFPVTSSSILKIKGQDLQVRYDDVVRDIDSDTNSCYTMGSLDDTVQTKETTLYLGRGDGNGARVGFRLDDLIDSPTAQNIKAACQDDKDGIVYVLGSYTIANPLFPNWVTDGS